MRDSFLSSAVDGGKWSADCLITRDRFWCLSGNCEEDRKLDLPPPPPLLLLLLLLLIIIIIPLIIIIPIIIIIIITAF